jgi:imidazolonepropionase-like amidohydrolase
MLVDPCTFVPAECANNQFLSCHLCHLCHLWPVYHLCHLCHLWPVYLLSHLCHLCPVTICVIPRPRESEFGVFAEREVCVSRFSVVTCAVVAILLQTAASSEQPQPAAGAPVAIRGGTVLTVTRGVIPNGTVVVRDGKIADVGADVAVPAGAQVVDAKGKFVTPGLIDAHLHISADSINEGATTVSSMTGIEDVLDPTDVDMYRDLAGGVTTANILHGSANPIGGKNAVIKMRWGKTKAEDLLFAGAMPGIKFALGENPKDLRQGFRDGPLRYPVTRMGVEYVIRDAFTRAKAYRAAWQDYERRRSAGETVIPPRRDLQLEPLVEVLEGKRLVHAHCYRADEILMLIRVAEEMGFKITTFQHVLEGYKVAKEIAAHGAGGSTFIDSWGGKPEMNDGIPYNPAVMTRKGVLVSINSDSAERSRRLNTDAAKAVKWGGVSQDEAIAMVTINAAKHLKLEDRVGSIETARTRTWSSGRTIRSASTPSSIACTSMAPSTTIGRPTLHA